MLPLCGELTRELTGVQIYYRGYLLVAFRTPFDFEHLTPPAKAIEGNSRSKAKALFRE
jgi:hypothetical protein